MASSGQEWLTLAEASEILGVHPATLRDWADAGEIPVARTPGGHRRFRRADVEALMQPRRVGAENLPVPTHSSADAVVAHVRHGLPHAPFVQQPAMMGMTDEERIAFRDAGQRLVHLAVQFVARRNGHEAVLLQAQEIGETYGEICGRHGLGLSDSVRTFTFFRDTVMGSICPEETIVGADEETLRIRREMQLFFDAPFYAMLAAYDRARAEWAAQA